MEPETRRVRVEGAVELTVYEWPGDDPPFLLAHATGFHGRIWDAVARRLAGRRVISFDFRGHGRSDKPAPPYDWRWFGEDVVAIIDALDLRGAIAAGHSKGGHAVAWAAAQRPHAFAALLLVDPVILPRSEYGKPMPGEVHFAARRRNEWGSAEEMFERFRGRLPFSRWRPEVLRDYCEHGLLPAPAGHGYVLACPPAVEASIYAGSRGRDIYDELSRIRVPVRVLRARTRGSDAVGVDMSSSPTAPDLARHFARGEDVYLPEHTHFIPMEDPDLIVRHLLELEQLSRQMLHEQ